MYRNIVCKEMARNHKDREKSRYKRELLQNQTYVQNNVHKYY